MTRDNGLQAVRWTGARPFVAGKKARQLPLRHAANQKPLAS
jgi:hypothetical protein